MAGRWRDSKVLHHLGLFQNPIDNDARMLLTKVEKLQSNTDALTNQFTGEISGLQQGIEEVYHTMSEERAAVIAASGFSAPVSFWKAFWFLTFSSRTLCCFCAL